MSIPNAVNTTCKAVAWHKGRQYSAVPRIAWQGSMFPREVANEMQGLAEKIESAQEAPPNVRGSQACEVKCAPRLFWKETIERKAGQWKSALDHQMGR